MVKEKIEKWLSSGEDFNSGIAILRETGKYSSLVRIISNRPWRYAGKLKYELMKLAGLQSAPPVPSLNTPKPPVSDPVLPSIISRIIKEHSEAYITRSRIHEQMAKLQGNSEEIVSQRKALSDAIALLSPRIEQLYAAKEAFYKENILPLEQDLFPEVHENPLPVDVNVLKKQKKNLQSANVKDQNYLDYQAETRSDILNPLPSGPRRTKIEKRILSRKQQIEAIDQKIVSLC